VEQIDNPESQPAPAGGADWVGRVLAAALLLWIALVTLGVPAVTWSAEQLLMSGGLEPAGWLWSAVVMVQALLVLAPAALLAWFWSRPRFKAIFTLWALAALFQLFGAAVQLPGPAELPVVWLLQLGLALLFALLIGLLARRWPPASTAVEPAPAGWLALAAGLSIAIPWAAGGAAGSPLETAVNVVLALAFGLAAALLLQNYLFRPLYAGRSAPLSPGLLLGAAFVAAGALLPLGSGFAYRGMAVPMALLLAAAALPAVALGRARRNLLPLTLLLGAAAGAPLLFLDPRELALAGAFALLELLVWVGEALILSVLIAAFAGIVLLAARWLWQQRPDRPAAARPLAVLLALLAAGAFAFFYLREGNPGFYGERLFVVLRDQADLGGVPDGDSATRRRYVYETLVAHAEQSQADLRAALDEIGAAYTPYYLVNGLEVEGGPPLRLWLERRPEVDRVLDNPTLRPVDLQPSMGQTQQPPATLLPNLAAIRADEVWAELGVRGAGIVVGQSDSGVQWDHPELADSYRGASGEHSGNWLDPWFGERAPYDVSGHGTHTLGTVLGNNTGVAPDATWFACANLVRNLGNPALYLSCMQFMLAPYPDGGDPFADGDPARGADVLNNSWGCPEEEGCDPTVLRPAVLALRQAGIFFAVSAGNEGPTCGSVASPPAIYDEAFSVGAIEPGGGLALFSSRGPVTVDGSRRLKPDVVAPGVDVLSAYPGNSYSTLQGTSMAGPHVAGVVALMWSANPALRGNVAATEQILIDTAQPLPEITPACGGDAGANNDVGHGLVDAYAAVQAALDWQP